MSSCGARVLISVASVFLASCLGRTFASSVRRLRSGLLLATPNHVDPGPNLVALGLRQVPPRAFKILVPEQLLHGLQVDARL
jgi:hypothetical protein